MRIRWGVLISGNGSTMQSLMDARELVDIAVVISSKAQAYGVVRARRGGVPVEILPDHLRGSSNREAAEDWMLNCLRSYNVQKIFLAGFMRIISPKFIRAYEGNIFNVHPSLLPKHKGLEALESAIKAGDKTSGATVHHVVPEVDSGKILAQREFEIPAHRESALTHLWLHINEQRVIRDTLRKIQWQNRLT